MKKMFPAALGAALVVAPVAASGQPVVATQVPSVTAGSVLPSNTEVFVALDNKLDSVGVKVGDPISFRVARDVMIGNYIVIPRGTPASGKVSLRSGRGAFGKSAKVEFDIDTIALPGRSVAVSGHYRLAGDGNTGATLGAVAAAGLVGGLFVKGRSAVAQAGTEYKVMTKEPLTLQVGAN